ncbi:hypothetical protein F2P56_012643 [Juglans regia]|uniref:Uncharacterized protein LOC109021488 n=2 Tax=Juglans regia TaxID=51240 RepID=A0A2I4HU43_JUGRE|nr:uncharacterized protein LOC109021488 [Juglans regia]KAF5468497.1 hypothetical protein F2P56_012643 [Juglans regia]
MDKARHLRLGKGGAGALREYLLRMQYRNPGFFALMDLDDDGRLKNVFWADPRSRAAYQYFGDVVAFDTTYLTNRYEDEVRMEEFTKPVTHYVDFSEEDTTAKCSCGLFQMRGILCRYILVIFKCNGIKSVPNTYILDRWRKDIKRSHRMFTHAACSSRHTEDATTKLYAMIELYRANQEPPSITLTGASVGCTTAYTTTVGNSKRVLSPNVVRGKGRPPYLGRASRMEKDMRKVKAKTKRAPVMGKHKQDICDLLIGEMEEILQLWTLVRGYLALRRWILPMLNKSKLEKR